MSSGLEGLADALLGGVNGILARRSGVRPARPRKSCERPPKGAVEDLDCPESDAGAHVTSNRAALGTMDACGASPIPPMEWDSSPSDLTDRRSMATAGSAELTADNLSSG